MKKIQKNWLEWTVFATALFCVTGTVGYLIYAVRNENIGPPQLQVEVGDTIRQGKMYAIPIEVTNLGSQAAESADVEVSLLKSDSVVERSSFEIQYVPGGSSRQGWVVFHADPSTVDQIMARPVGYEVP